MAAKKHHPKSGTKKTAKRHRKPSAYNKAFGALRRKHPEWTVKQCHAYLRSKGLGRKAKKGAKKGTKRGTKKGAKRGTKKGAKRGTKKGAKRAPKKTVKRAKKSTKRAPKKRAKKGSHAKKLAKKIGKKR